jgi:hypothetical protein
VASAGRPSRPPAFAGKAGVRSIDGANFLHGTRTGARSSELVLGDGVDSVSLGLVGRALVRLTVSLQGTGRVTGPGIDCGSACSVVADIGDTIALEDSTNGSGFFFSGCPTMAAMGRAGPVTSSSPARRR